MTQTKQNLFNSFTETTLFFISISILRMQLSLHLSLGFAELAAAGLYVGLLLDLFITLLLRGIATFVSGFLPVKKSFVLAALMAFAWACTAANVLHFCFFEQKLHLWIASAHLKNLMEIAGIITTLLAAPLILLSIFTLGFCTFHCLRKPTLDSIHSESRGHAIWKGALFIVAILLMHQAPTWFKAQNPFKGSVLADQILLDWWNDWLTSDKGLLIRQAFADAQPPTSRVAQTAAQTLRQFQAGVTPPARESTGLPRSKTPLQNAAPAESETASLRLRLGLDPHKPVNVIVLFLESARAFELLHPTIGPRVFPRLHGVLKAHGTLFTQAYSSARTTVNGQFSALCSYLPNLLGPEIYAANENLKIPCIQEVLKEKGYRTLWFHSNHKHFLNKHAFESKHGTETFYDKDYYRAQGITETVGDCAWGYSDGPVLQASLGALEKNAGDQKPFFANILTISTHMPFNTPTPGGRLPLTLLAEMQGAPEYQAFLSRWRYADDALGAFFDRFFKSKLASNTVIFLLGDHGIGVQPHPSLKANLGPELWNRLAFAVVSAKMKKPGKIPTPVHQMDLAPSIASLVGVAAPAPWLGKSLFAPHKSLWVGVSDDQVAYRDDTTACYPKAGGRISCFDVSNGEDPLFEHSLKALPEDAKKTVFFQNVLLSIKGLVEMNLVSHQTGGSGPSAERNSAAAR